VLKTFKTGGVHPEEHKLSADRPIEQFTLPKKAVIPMSQHIGAPAEPIVKKGEQVKTGQLLAKASAFVSANIHSPFSGKITKIDNAYTNNGYKRPCILMDVEGDDWDESIIKNNAVIKECNLNSEEIINKIKEAGIVGLGGATFPSHIKCTPPKGKEATYLLINGAECEPYLTSDYMTMIDRDEEFLVGVNILMKALKVEKAIIGIENNKPLAVQRLRKLLRTNNNIEVAPLKVKYPQGGEKQLIKAILGREVPSGGLPIDVGVVVFNVGTTCAVYDAVQKNKPLFERVVTVTGKDLDRPSNFMVRIGTPISELVNYCGGLPENTGKVIQGGPMMGIAANTLDIPVAKGTSGILIMPEGESQRPSESNCIRCAKCVSACPVNLEPYHLRNLAASNNCEQLKDNHVMDCIECGSCSYTCPANIPLLDYIRLGKSNVSQMLKQTK
jgi:electron transport complex protein RnfC